MNIRLEIVRFRNEDVIAASSLCQNFGRHFYAEEVEYLPENDDSTIIRYSGGQYNYTADGGLEWATRSSGEYRYNAASISDGYIRLEQGKWYYIGDNAPWKGTLCVPQTH